ncbi:MAG: hypothetical protein JKY93_00325 [Gammaproteobacteria bacterium]|nr:hypothetical protein [Gammaproteobacteria bacterium]MBL4898899.1 hypothetical protein [Colwellia sp.]
MTDKVVYRLTVKTLVAVILLVVGIVALAEDNNVAYEKSCLSCHGSTVTDGVASGPQLGGLSKQYILEQLKGFREGLRGAGDPEAQLMSEAIKQYRGEELSEIAQWASNSESKQRFDDSRVKDSKGYQIYVDRCKGCHSSMVGRLMTGSPRLSELDSGYIIRQLNFFAEDFRSFDQPSKHQLKMQAVVKSLTDDEFVLLTRFIISASQDKEEVLNESTF